MHFLALRSAEGLAWSRELRSQDLSVWRHIRRLRPHRQSPEPHLPSPRTLQHGATVGMLPSQEFRFS